MITGLAKKNLRSAPAVFGSQQHTESLKFIGVADPFSFLIVDDREESRALLGRGLLKKFSGCTCVECEDSEMAVALLGKVIYAAAVVHRAADADGAPVVELLRQARAEMPIVMVSGIDRSAIAREAGADDFLLLDEWERIGTVVAGVMLKSV